ncbi:MAG TPA: redoxin domain-containing protein [Desulfonatronum sp.]|nr:redoxin domain-containing protein [Desulfonatronum sp.]
MIRFLSIISCLTLLVASAPALAQDGPFSPGDVLPQMELPAPEDPAHVQYLGLKPDVQTFTLSDLGDKALVIEIFSMYCPICQREAPQVNEIFALIQSKGLNDKIKLFGIGAGNSELEVRVFADKYATPFPLVPDPDYVLHKIFGGAGTPYFLALVPTSSGEYTVRLSHLGGFDSAESFLKTILKAVDIK